MNWNRNVDGDGLKSNDFFQQSETRYTTRRSFFQWVRTEYGSDTDLPGTNKDKVVCYFLFKPFFLALNSIIKSLFNSENIFSMIHLFIFFKVPVDQLEEGCAKHSLTIWTEMQIMWMEIQDILIVNNFIFLWHNMLAITRLSLVFINNSRNIECLASLASKLHSGLSMFEFSSIKVRNPLQFINVKLCLLFLIVLN